MTCATCGSQNADGKRFCTKCGAALPAAGGRTASDGLPPPSAGSTGRPVPSSAATLVGKKGRGCLGTIGCAILALLVLLVVVGGGGYLAVTNKLITTTQVSNTILNLIGRGPGDVELDNFRDDTLNVAITSLDVRANATATPGPDTRQIKPANIVTYHVQDPGHYRVDFRASTGSTNLGACTLTVRSGDKYQFVALPDTLVVNLKNHPSTVGADLIVQTSSFCR